MVSEPGPIRLTKVLDGVGLSRSSWYYRSVPESARRRPGPKPMPIPPEIIQAVVPMAKANPWYGYQRIAVMCRRAGESVTDRQAYRVMADQGLLQQKRPYEAELYQASKLYELLRLAEFQQRYNMLRPHWALVPEAGGDPVTPYDVYVSGQAIRIPKWQGWAKGAKKRLEQLLTKDSAA